MNEFWANGYDDYWANIPLNENPYAPGTAAYTHWQRGWFNAETARDEQEG